MPKKALLIRDAIDENLKLVRDEDGTDTPLELAKTKAKINGELTIEGDITVEGKLITSGGGSSILTTTTGADVDLYSANNVKISSENGIFQFFGPDGVLNEMQGGSAGVNLKMYDPDDPGGGSFDWAGLGVGANGELTISTTSLSDADINLSPLVGQVVITSDVHITTNKKLYFDSGGNTYIKHPTSGDVLDFYVGGIKMLHLDEASGDIEILADEVNLADEDGTTYTGDASASVQTKAQIDTAIGASKRYVQGPRGLSVRMATVNHWYSGWFISAGTSISAADHNYINISYNTMFIAESNVKIVNVKGTFSCSSTEPYELDFWDATMCSDGDSDHTAASQIGSTFQVNGGSDCSANRIYNFDIDMNHDLDAGHSMHFWTRYTDGSGNKIVYLNYTITITDQ